MVLINSSICLCASTGKKNRGLRSDIGDLRKGTLSNKGRVFVKVGEISRRHVIRFWSPIGLHLYWKKMWKFFQEFRTTVFWNKSRVLLLLIISNTNLLPRKKNLLVHSFRDHFSYASENFFCISSTNAQLKYGNLINHFPLYHRLTSHIMNL